MESFGVHSGKFSAEIDRDTTRTIASPQRAFFPWQLGVRKFTDLPDCVKIARRTRTQMPLANEPTGAAVGEKFRARPTSKLFSPEPIFSFIGS